LARQIRYAIAGPGWPALCLEADMSALAFRVNRKNGDYIKATVVPANHSEEPRLGLADGAIIAFFLLCVSGLVYLLLA
jgi:hypothetical protein